MNYSVKFWAKKGPKSKSIQYESEEAVHKALLELVIFICFLIATTIVSLSVRHLYMFYFNEAVRILFVNREIKTDYGQVNFEQMVTTSEWWSFLENNFLRNLHGIIDEETVTSEKQRTILRDNILLGPPRLRQIRVQADTCDIHQAFERYFDKCYAKYSANIEEQKAEHKGTKFRTLSELSATTLRGKIGNYVGGGYVQDLTYNIASNKEIMAKLKAQKWIDRGTRVVVVEFALFNANTNLFTNVKFIAELPPTGGIIPSTHLQALKMYALWRGTDYVAMVAAVIFYLMVLFYTIEEVNEVRHTSFLRYLSSIWNIVDFIIIFLAYCSFIYNIWHPFYLRSIIKYTDDDADTYHSLDVAGFWYMIYANMMAICAFLVWIKIFKFISFNKTMLQFSTTLKRCSKDLFGFGVMFAIVFLAYALLGLLLFSSTHPDFRNFQESMLTMMRMVLGDFNYTEIERANAVLGPIYFLTYILLVFFILLNMFLAIINDTYTAVKNEITYGNKHLQIFLVKQFQKFCVCLNKILVKLHFKKSPDAVQTLNEAHGSRSSDNTASVTTLYPKLSSASSVTNVPIRLRTSEIMRGYFEEVPEITIMNPSATDIQDIKRLTQRIALMEDIMEGLIGRLDKILKRVEARKRSKHD